MHKKLYVCALILPLFLNVANSQDFVEQYSLAGFTKDADGKTVVHVMHAQTGPQGPKGPPTRKSLKVKLPDQVLADLAETLGDVDFLSNLARYFNKDVELDDNQKSLFKHINRQYRQDSAKVIFQFGIGDLDEAELVKGLGAAKAKVDQSRSKLLPHQTKRFQFLKARMEIDINGLVDALTRGRLGKKLEIEHRQKDKILKIKREFEDELAKYVQDLRRDARKKIIKELDAKQLEKYKSIFGDDEVHESKEYMRKIISRMLTYFRL